MVYFVETTEEFERAFKKHRGNRKQLESIISKLEQYPDKYGKPLGKRLHGMWQERMGPFRIWYVIDEQNKRVRLITFKHKDEAKQSY